MRKRIWCRHCHANKINRPRGLCWTCYYRREVHDQYGPVDKYGAIGIRDQYGPAPLPVPTNTLPGTPERQAVYQARADRKESIFHPNDAR